MSRTINLIIEQLEQLEHLIIPVEQWGCKCGASDSWVSRLRIMMVTEELTAADAEVKSSRDDIGGKV